MPRSSSSSESNSRAQLGVQFGVQAGAQQLAGEQVVALAKRAADIERLLAFASSGGRRHGEQLVGNLGHGADHDERLLGQACLHDARDAIDGGGVLDRGAAELHDDHGRTTSAGSGGRAVTTGSLAP